MTVDVELLLVPLQTDADWRTLVTRVISQEPVVAVEQLVRHARSLRATAALVESPYIDRDYSAEYRFFHGQLF